MAIPIIRRATRQDVPAIVALLADDVLGAQREDASDPLPQSYYDAFDAVEANPDNAIWIAHAGGAVVGCFQLTFLPGLSRKGAWRAQLEAVRVAASARGERLGERMLRFAMDLAAERGCAMMQLTTDKSRRDAHRFYERLGFEATHEGMKLTL